MFFFFFLKHLCIFISEASSEKTSCAIQSILMQTNRTAVGFYMEQLWFSVPTNLIFSCVI